jgi:hypothetical protein
MRSLALGLVVLLAACAPAPTAITSVAPVTSATPLRSNEPTVFASAAPIPMPTPMPLPEYGTSPTVTVGPAIFPVMTTLRLKLAVVDEGVINSARSAVERYLASIDYYRNGLSPALPITGAFLDAVSLALKDSATPGVKREFKLESLTVDRHVQKPWGTHAYVDVTVTIVDRAVDGNAPDQRETGKLRLTGDKMFVTDGWDFEHDRWFNGFGPLPLERVRSGVAEAVQNYLWFEMWSTSTTAPGLTSTESAFTRARAARLGAIDRKQVASNSFEEVTASIERFETIDGIWTGLATVRVKGTNVRTNGAGQTSRVPFERHVIAFVLGNWISEVVDDETSSGVWASGGDLALDQVDINRA